MEITKYFYYEPRFNGVYSRDNLPRIKDGAYVINLNDKKVKEHIGFHLLLTEILLLYFDSFEIEYIPHKVLNKIKDKSITHNIFRI